MIVKLNFSEPRSGSHRLNSRRNLTVDFHLPSPAPKVHLRKGPKFASGTWLHRSLGNVIFGDQILH